MAYRSCGIAKYLNKEVLVYPSSFTGDFEKNRFQPIRVSMEGSVFKEAGASISVVDLGADYMERTENSGAKTLIAKYTSQPTDNYLGGLWTIELPNYGISYQYLLSNATNKIEKKGKTFEISLDDIRNCWAVLKTNSVYKKADFPQFKNLVNQLMGEAATLEPNIICDTPITLDTSLDYFSEEGLYQISNSTFLEEIQKLLEEGGLNLYSDPRTGTLKVINPLEIPTTIYPSHILSAIPPSNPSKNTDYKYLAIKSAEFNLDYKGIPTSVVVTDGVNPKTYVYGRYDGSGNVIDLSNYNIAKRDQLSYLQIYGLNPSQMAITAKRVYNLGASSARVLKVTIAGLPFIEMLWTILQWTDSMGNTGNWLITDYNIEISANSFFTTITAYKVD